MRMRRAIKVSLACGVMVGVTVSVLAASQPQRGETQPGPGLGRGRGAEFAGPPQGPNDVPIVEVIGCLTQGPGNAWMVNNATEPVKAPIGFSKPEELKAAESKALGTLQIRLIGFVEFTPANHKGHKVVVKGMWIKDTGEPRLNVTSLMTASATCK
jgi:hypothetical protein